MNDRIYLTKLGTYLALVGPLFLMAPFQNCTQAKFGTNSQPSIGRISNNGGNYDGKPFVHMDTNAPCPAKDPVRSVIVYKDGKYRLAKEECVDVSPARDIADSDIQVDPAHAAMLSYKDKKFIFDSTTLAAAVPDLNCMKKNFGPVDSLKIYIVAGPSGPMMTGYFAGGGTTAILAFDKTVLDTSASATLQGESQDANIYVILDKFDPSAPYPDGTNTAVTYSNGPLGSNSFAYCVRPNGSL